MAEVEVTIRNEVELIEATVTETEVFEVGKQGPPGPPGPIGPPGGATAIQVGAQPLSGHTVVACGSDGKLIYADCTNAAHTGTVVGLLESAYAAGDEATIRIGYTMSHSGWSWSLGPVFVGQGGQLVQTLPSGAAFSQVVAWALSSTEILIDIQPPIVIN